MEAVRGLGSGEPTGALEVESGDQELLLARPGHEARVRLDGELGVHVKVQGEGGMLELQLLDPRVGEIQQRVPAVVELDDEVSGRVAGRVAYGDAGRDLAVAVDELERGRALEHGQGGARDVDEQWGEVRGQARIRVLLHPEVPLGAAEVVTCAREGGGVAGEEAADVV